MAGERGKDIRNCSRGSQPRWMSLPPLIVELLKRKIRELKEVFEEGGKYTIAGVNLIQNDPSISRGLPFPAEKCYGRDTALIEISKYLNENLVKRIAVWGMGGIGKTTLMKQIHNQFLREDKFDKVIWVTVSSKLDVPQIQNEISKQMDGKPMKEEDASTRARMTLALLQRGNNFLILDDMWETFTNEYVGIPAELGSLKIVLTTRASYVARRMDCDEVIKLMALSFDETFQLFLDEVGTVVLSDDKTIKPRLKVTMIEIVEECLGLPLAIVTIARTMKGMSGHQHTWDKALKRLREGIRAAVAKIDPILEILKFNYDHLEGEKIQHCFLFCALFPEDFKIPKSRLIEYWIEEGLIDQIDNRHEMTGEGHEILRKLQDRCLLECVIEDDE